MLDRTPTEVYMRQIRANSPNATYLKAVVLTRVDKIINSDTPKALKEQYTNYANELLSEI